MWSQERLSQEFKRVSNVHITSAKETCTSVTTNVASVLAGGVPPSKRLLGMCRWMGSHFHNWTDYNGVADFRDFWDKKILVSRDLKIGRFG